MRPGTRHVDAPGFTLIELLVVISIMLLVMGMMMSFPVRERTRADVEAAAEELAGTLREARGRALRMRSVFAVAFNIQNGKGTSGKVINNWDGGHWYHIQGPSSLTSMSMAANGAPVPPIPRLASGGRVGNTRLLHVADYVKEMDASWQGERRYLPARKVRFLALLDQDNGGLMDWSTSVAYPPSYPRPWFGWFAAGRLYPWGGYDHGITGSGFGFEGLDGAISGCTNPRTRMATHDASVELMHQGETRPLISGRLSDFRIMFLPDGQVRIGDLFLLKCESWATKGGVGGSATTLGDLGDLYVQENKMHEEGITELSPMHAIGSHERASGYWYITLSPDIEDDTDAFPDVGAAIRSMMPMVRVGINRFGDVRVIRVQLTAPTNPYDDTMKSASDWQNAKLIGARYRHNILRAANGVDQGGLPIVDRITPEMLVGRRMWTTP